MHADALDPGGSQNGRDSVPTRYLGTSVPTVVVLYVPCKVHLVPLVPLGRWYCQRFNDPTHNDLWLSLLRHRPQRASESFTSLLERCAPRSPTQPKRKANTEP